jgi:hypothetical protein
MNMAETYLRKLHARIEATTFPDLSLEMKLRDLDPDRYDGMMPRHYVSSLEAAIGLVERVLPGWFWTCGLCSLTGHASIGPDYNGPHRERLLREFPSEIFDHGGFDADLPPGDGMHRVCLALLSCMVLALIAIEEMPGRPVPSLAKDAAA